MWERRRPRVVVDMEKWRRVSDPSWVFKARGFRDRRGFGSWSQRSGHHAGRAETAEHRTNQDTFCDVRAQAPTTCDRFRDM